jgi:hypothetical protein
VARDAEILREISCWTVEELHARVILYARAAISGRLITVSQLARRARLSQPHVTNILGGARGLTPSAADALLRALDLRSVLDLYTTGELRAYLDTLTQPGIQAPPKTA